MKSKLKLIPTKDMSQDDWLRYRKNGVGASEVGTILGLNPYKCSAQLFYEKIGGDVLNLENMAMFMGKEQEDFIANLWQFWEGDESSTIANYRAGKVVRRCQRVNAYVTNPDFPWLFVSLDRKINKRQPKMIASPYGPVEGIEEKEGALELKTIAGYEADKWEAGIPPSHVIQVQTQLLVCGFSFGELAVLRDGRQFDVIPFEANPGIQETIIERTRLFWNRVTRGRELMTAKFEAERNFNYQRFDELEAELIDIEPAPDGSEAFAKYLKERYKIAEPGEQEGNEDLLAWAAKDLEAMEDIKAAEERRREAQNTLKNVLRDGADKLTFGPHGFVSWKANKNGVRTFLNKTKPA